MPTSTPTVSPYRKCDACGVEFHTNNGHTCADKGPRIRAVDDFAAIRSRLDQIQREQEEVLAGKPEEPIKIANARAIELLVSDE